MAPFFILASHERNRDEIVVAREFTFDRSKYTKSVKSTKKKRVKKRA